MKIISKFKDYYDYLQGIYGVDEKIIYDRTMITPISPPHLLTPGVKYFQLAICNILYCIYYFQGEYYFGDEVKIQENTYQHGEIISPRYLKWYRNYRPKHLTTTDLNIKNQQPILLVTKNDTNPNIKLLDFGINHLIPPNEMYLMLSTWLSTDKVIVDSRTDREKIVGRGFDLKTSFRKRP